MPTRRLPVTVLALTSALAAGLVAAPAAPAATPGTPPTAAELKAAPDFDAVLNVLPPGADGVYTSADVAMQRGNRQPPNTTDQLEMYDLINTVPVSSITDASLATYFKNGSLGVDPADVVRTDRPREGTTILRDRFGVPHVYGTTYSNTAYGAGYAGTQDRMFLQDALRHAGSATLTSFLGPSPANIAADAAQLRSAAYPVAEAEAQIAKVAQRYPQEAPRLVAALDDFLKGINDAQRMLCPVATAPTCPAEYAALQIVPADFTRADIVYIASLVGGIFGKGGGGEYATGNFLNALEDKTGSPAEARVVLDDLVHRDDPEAPVTTGRSFPYDEPGPLDPAANLRPDRGAAVVGSTGSRAAAGGAPVAAPSGGGLGLVDGPLGPIDLRPSAHGLSNALVVNADRSATGHPIAVFGPQTGYTAPQLLTEVDLNGPGIAARGASFAGTQLIVQLGHGVDYAWSATSASSDNVDQLFEILCDTAGGAAKTDSDGYLGADGQCTKIDRYVHRQLGKPGAGATNPPAQVDLVVERTRHGIVQLRTTAGGKPVALVSQRSTYGGELDSAVGFARINDPDYVKSVDDFRRAFEAVDYTFNWLYVDDRDTGYYLSGLIPTRAAGVDRYTPRVGAAAYDWTGFLPPAQHPQDTNPSRGYLTSWNNKPAPGFAAADNNWGHGSVQRVQALNERIEAVLAKGRMTRAGLVGAMQDAATVDSRAFQLLPELLAVVNNDAELRAYTALLAGWRARGAHRLDQDRVGGYSDQAAIALFDAWYEDAARTVLRGRLGDLAATVPTGIDDHPRLHVGSAWNNVAFYGYVDKDLRRVLGEKVAGPYDRGYCGGGVLAVCRAELQASLSRAVKAQIASQGTSDTTRWVYDKTLDSIIHTALGVGSVRAIDWQNRPTFQQVVAFSRSRRPAAPAVASVVVTAPERVTAGNAPLLSGKVLGTSGRGVAGVVVSVTGAESFGTGAAPVGTATTRADGVWSLRVRPQRQTTYVATAGGRSARRTILVATRLELSSPAAAGSVANPVTFRGVLAPAFAGVEVGLATVRPFRVLQVVRTDPAGRFAITRALPRGTDAYVVFTSAHQGTLPGSKSLTLSPG